MGYSLRPCDRPAHDNIPNILPALYFYNNPATMYFCHKMLSWSCTQCTVTILSIFGAFLASTVSGVTKYFHEALNTLSMKFHSKLKFCTPNFSIVTMPPTHCSVSLVIIK